MATIDIKLKSYDELTFEITRLNTDLFLKDKEIERLKEQNNDLRRIYKNTYNRLFQNGNDELARYFQAQIDDCPTFYVEPIIDFAKEWKDYKSRIDKAIEYIKEDMYGEPNELYGLVDGEHLLNILQSSDNNSK